MSVAVVTSHKKRYTAQKVKFSIKDFFSSCKSNLRIWSHLLKKSIMENFIFCAVMNESKAILICKNKKRKAMCKKVKR